jgi:hypothetical protein
MFGKHYESMYSGSMYGAGIDVFAVWGWVISHTVKSRVEVNLKRVADELGAKEEEIEAAISKLCSPDPNSRNKEHDGRRMVKEGVYQYFIPSHDIYHSIKNEDDRREQNRTAKQKQRLNAKVKAALTPGTPRAIPRAAVSLDVVEVATEAAESFLPPDNGGLESKVSIEVVARKGSLERRLDAYFSRGNAGVSRDHDEDKKLLQIAHRPSCKEELDIILAHHKSLPDDQKRYYPMASVMKLLEVWTKLLDTARMASGVNPGDPDAKARGDALWEKMAPAFAKGIGDQFRVNP